MILLSKVDNYPVVHAEVLRTCRQNTLLPGQETPVLILY